MHHLPVIYEHLTVKEKVALNHITKMASKLSNIKLSSLLTTVAGRVKTKALRMVAVSSSPVLKLDTLPSGRYKTLRHRTNCHSYKKQQPEPEISSCLPYPLLITMKYLLLKDPMSSSQNCMHVVLRGCEGF